jgi:hypothetical protein
MMLDPRYWMLDAGFRSRIQDTGSMMHDEKLQTPTRPEGSRLEGRFPSADPASASSTP